MDSTGKPSLLGIKVLWAEHQSRWGFSPFEGDGNGFKLGGGAKDTAVAHVVKNSIGG
jgi:hypothetical protein